MILMLSMMSGTALADTMEAFKAEVSKQFIEGSPWDKNDIEVDEVQITSPDTAPGRFDRVLLKAPRGMKNIGRVTALATIFSGGKEVKSLWVSARIRVFKDAVVALNPIRMNKRVAKGDLKLVRMELGETNEAVESIEEAEGMVSKRPISAGAVIRKDYLKQVPLIKRGERVILIVENGQFKIKSTGVASEDGYRGGLIAVRTALGKEVTGKVAGPGEITVEF